MPADLGPVIEWAAVITGIAGVALTVRQKVLSWPVGMISTALFLVLFLDAGLYADSVLQGLYIAMGAYGWWAWLHGGPRGGALTVTTLTTRARLAIAVAAAAAALAVGAWLDANTDSTLPYPDAVTTVLSITAQVLLTRKKLDSWPLWILGVNVPYIGIYLVKGLVLTAALQLVFICLSIAGWRAWRASMAAAR